MRQRLQPYHCSRFALPAVIAAVFTALLVYHNTGLDAPSFDTSIDTLTGGRTHSMLVVSEGTAHDPPWISARVVVYEGAHCDALSLRRGCRTRSANKLTDIRGDTECAASSGCYVKALLHASVQVLPRGSCAPARTCTQEQWTLNISFSTPLSGHYLVHMRKDHTSLTESLDDCIFSQSLQTVHRSTFLGAALLASPKLLQVNHATGRTSERGFWLRQNRVDGGAWCGVRAAEQLNDLYWVRSNGEVNCVAMEAQRELEFLHTTQLIILGDSVGRFLFQALQQLAESLRYEVIYNELKPKPRPSRERPLDDIRQFFSELTPLGQPEQQRVLLFNPASLWWCAYGSLEDYTWSLDRILPLLEGAVLRKKTRVIFWTGTAVFPIHYFENISMSNKICMTEPRVEALNTIALRKLPILAPHVEVVDLWQMSASREDDPLTPGDMRHNSQATYSEMALMILHQIAKTYNST